MRREQRPGGRRLHGVTPREDVERELASHLEMRAEELVAEGWERGAALAEARRRFGDYEDIRSDCSAIAARHAQSRRRTAMLEELWRDAWHAVRGLRRAPAFALLAVITLGLGIGSTVAAFTIVNGVLLAPLPYPQPDRLVAVWERDEHGNEAPLAWPNYADWRAQATSFEHLAVYGEPFVTTVVGGGAATRARVARVSANFFAALGVAPRSGRTFRSDLRSGDALEVVVSEGFWRERLGAVPDLSKLSVDIGGSMAAVVGVMPAGFELPTGAQVWTPLDVHPPGAMGTRTAHNFRGLGRLRAGVAPEAAAAELTQVTQRLRTQHAEMNAHGASVHDLRRDAVSHARRTLLVLFAASVFVLLVACTNLASGLMARATQRQHELAMRASLGAARGRLVRQLLTESLVLSAIGAVAGLILGWALVQAAAALGGGGVPRLAEIHIDARVVGFTVALAVLTAVGFGTAPALRATQVAGVDRLGARTVVGVRRRAGWSLLVGAEVGLAVLLLVGAGLMIRSSQRLAGVDPGYRIDGQLVVGVSLPAARYAEESRRVQFYDELVDRAAALPAVGAVAMSMTAPLAGFDPNGLFHVEGREESPGAAHYRVVGAGYFETLQTPIVEGRAFSPADRAGGQPVAVINESMARMLPDGGPALGRRIRTGGMDAYGDVEATIVGIVADVRYSSLDAAPRPAYYLPYAQRPGRIGEAHIIATTPGGVEAAASAIRAIVRDMDADVAVETTTLAALAGDTFAARRFVLFVLGTFASIALLLAALGIYGVVSFAVAQRMREIGLRIALGEAARSVLWTVSRATMTSVLAGLLIGLLAALALARVLASLLYEVTPLDPATYAGVALVLLLCALTAALLPATRALGIDPMTTLRE